MTKIDHIVTIHPLMHESIKTQKSIDLMLHQTDVIFLKAFDKFYSWFPSFLDIFPDEEAFLNFAFWFVILTIGVAFIASRFIKIKPHQI